MQTTCAALDLFVQRERCDAAKSTSRTAYRQKLPGQVALHWLLSTDKLDTVELKVVPRFAYLTTFCLVGEGADNYLRDWITARQSIRPGEQVKDYDKRLVLFGGQKIQGALDAYLYWTSSKDPFADAFNFIEACWAESRRHGYTNGKGNFLDVLETPDRRNRKYVPEGFRSIRLIARDTVSGPRNSRIQSSQAGALPPLGTKS